MLVFEERRKPEFPEKNLSEQSREPTNSTHIWRRVRESNPGHWWKVSALTTAPTPLYTEMCSQPGSTGVELVACSHTYPPWYVTRFLIRVLDQCDIVGAMKTSSDYWRRVVVDLIDCLCNKSARFQVRRAYRVHLFQAFKAAPVTPTRSDIWQT